MRFGWLTAATACTLGAATAAQAPAGYLDPVALPDPARFIGPPPAAGTPALAADVAAYRAAGATKGGPAWTRAAQQLDPWNATMLEHASCAIGAVLDPAATPATVRLLHRTVMDAERTAQRAKAVYKRPRPYAAEPGPVACDPRSVGGGGSTSYPSGSAASGWLWGLLLAELRPARAGEALAFGAEIGDNRVACRVHYPSDVTAGRMVGAAVYAAERSSPAFLADVESAKREIAAAPPKRC